MKTIFLILPLTGTALLASAGEPVKTNAPSASVKLTAARESPTAPTVTRAAANKASNEKVAEGIVSSEATTVKPLPSTTQTVWQSLNPFAPLERAPATPWLSRAPWSAAAESAAKGSVPVEMRHESQCGVVICRR